MTLLFSSSAQLSLPFASIPQGQVSMAADSTCCCKGRACQCMTKENSACCSVQTQASTLIFIQGSSCEQEEKNVLLAFFSKLYCTTSSTELLQKNNKFSTVASLNEQYFFQFQTLLEKPPKTRS